MGERYSESTFFYSSRTEVRSVEATHDVPSTNSRMLWGSSRDPAITTFGPGSESACSASKCQRCHMPKSFGRIQKSSSGRYLCQRCFNSGEKASRESGRYDATMGYSQRTYGNQTLNEVKHLRQMSVRPDSLSMSVVHAERQVFGDTNQLDSEHRFQRSSFPSRIQISRTAPALQNELKADDDSDLGLECNPLSYSRAEEGVQISDGNQSLLCHETDS